jgi:hypothetical protein
MYPDRSRHCPDDEERDYTELPEADALTEVYGGSALMAAKPAKKTRVPKAKAGGVTLSPAQRAYLREETGTLESTLWAMTIRQLKCWMGIFLPDAEVTTKDEAVTALYQYFVDVHGVTSASASSSAAAAAQIPAAAAEAEVPWVPPLTHTIGSMLDIFRVLRRSPGSLVFGIAPGLDSRPISW